MFWTSSSGRIELNITRQQAESCTHSGPCDADVRAVSQLPKVGQQLRRIAPSVLAAELSEYGAWDEYELADHDQNMQRVLWLACGDICEEQRA